MSYIPIVDICGVKITNVSMVEAVSAIESFVDKNRNEIVVTPNVDHIIKLQKDNEFRDIYRDSSLVLADGMPLLWAARFLGRPLKEKVSGSDLFPNLCGVAQQKKFKLFFLGGRPTAGQKARDILQNRYPGINIVGVYSPPFGFEKDPSENEKIKDMIRDARPDILFVGLGAPKQEKWIYTNYKELEIPVSIGIGVTFEFIAGMVTRAPVWMQKIGLEWFWRFIMEPKRLWRRYFVDDMKFFWLVLKQRTKRT